MNYEEIYNSLIQKRLQNEPSKLCKYEVHHIKPRSLYPSLVDDPSNLVKLTLREHFFAHILLQRIYREKYGKHSAQYFKMLSAINLMMDCKKYKIRTSRLYAKIKIDAYARGVQKTTTGRKWVTNGKKDIFLRVGESIPNGFRQGRTINFTEEQKKEYSRKLSEGHKGKPSWNSGKRGIYSAEYRRKISECHADVSGEKNGRYGSRAMVNLKTGDRKIVSKDQIDEYLNNGYVIRKNLKIFNNGQIEILALSCPNGFVKGKLSKRNLHMKQHNKKSNL